MASLVACPWGHALEAKKVSGIIFGVGLKHCTDCGRQLNAPQTRYSCKGCGFHLCGACHAERRDSIARKSMSSSSSAPPSFPPGAPSMTATPSMGPTCSMAPTPSGDGRPPCKYGAGCYNFEPEHRAKFSHPDPLDGGSTLNPSLRRACKYGSRCYQRNSQHLESYVHPGDRNYRVGLVVFGSDQHPEFESLWQLFQFYDPDESGHLSKEEFERTLESCRLLVHELDARGEVPEDPDQAWVDADGPRSGFVSFRQFVTWTREFLFLDFPLGLEVAGSSRPCRFRIMSEDGMRCSCPAYTPVEGSTLCMCGHKASMHRSDFAERSLTKFLEDSSVDQTWQEGEEGLVRIEDEELLSKLQAIMTACHKTTNNWTRDRGCKLHGVNGCGPSCSFKNKAPVPTGYVLMGAFRNQNADLWQKYMLMARAMCEGVGRQDEVPLESVPTATSSWEIDAGGLDAERNEWYLWHGSSPTALRGICSSNFRLALAGTGATWKDAGKAMGTPLYGYGIYLAEHITKADEYSQPLNADDGLRVIDDADVELHCVLLCRVFGGRTRMVTTNEFEIDKLRSDVFEGPYDSVFGDRVSTLNKPFREIVVYDKDQCFPEFLLVYQRSYE